MSEPELSVVIPAYNEAATIRQTVEAIERYLNGLGTRHEILIIDDGSTDGTAGAVRELAGRPGSTVRLLQGRHLGKGAAVKQGMLEARGACVLFMDADHSTKIDEWAKCAPWLRDGYDVVIGTRKTAGADVRVHQPPLREAMGRGFTWLTNVLLTGSISDITCGFKCFRQEAARRIFSQQRLDGWGFDAEILFIARRQRCRLKEVPVIWADHRATKVRLLRDAVGSFLELLQIRLGAMQGRYPSPPEPH